MQISKCVIIALLIGSIPATAGTTDYQRIVDYYASAKHFSGAVLVASKGRVDFSRATGLSNRQSGAKLTTKSIFRICSLTKTFTAVLILQLVEAGKLDLNAPISKYLPAYAGPGRDSITVRHLLTYSSGIDNIDQREEAIYTFKATPDEIISKYFSGPLVSEPGKKFSYKNADFFLLGKIIEALYGKAFSEVLDEKIIKPYRLTTTSYLRNGDIVPGLANSYLYDSKTGFRNDDPYWIENFYAGGAMRSTLDDLLTFDQAIFSARLFSESTLNLMLTPNPELYNVAYGFWVSDIKLGNVKTRAADRQGDISGNKASWLHLIPENKTIIVLANSDAANVNEIRDNLALASLGQKVELK